MGCILCKTCKHSCQDIGRAIKRGSMDLKRLRKSTENEENEENNTEMKTVTESLEVIESPEEVIESPEEVIESPEEVIESPEAFPGERVEEDSPSEHSKDSNISQNPSVCGSDFEFVNQMSCSSGNAVGNDTELCTGL